MGEILIHFRKITVKGLKNLRDELTLEKLGKILIINVLFSEKVVRQGKNVKKYFEACKIIPYVIKKLSRFWEN